MQDELHKKYPDTTALHTMCWMNFWGSIYSMAYLFVVTSTGRELLAFCRLYNEVLIDVLLFCLCGAIGQVSMICAKAKATSHC